MHSIIAQIPPQANRSELSTWWGTRAQAPKTSVDMISRQRTVLQPKRTYPRDQPAPLTPTQDWDHMVWQLICQCFQSDTHKLSISESVTAGQGPVLKSDSLPKHSSENRVAKCEQNLQGLVSFEPLCLEYIPHPSPNVWFKSKGSIPLV
jgi:hypothetical protein